MGCLFLVHNNVRNYNAYAYYQLNVLPLTKIQYDVHVVGAVRIVVVSIVGSLH